MRRRVGPVITHNIEEARRFVRHLRHRALFSKPNQKRKHIITGILYIRNKGGYTGMPMMFIASNRVNFW